VTEKNAITRGTGSCVRCGGQGCADCGQPRDDPEYQHPAAMDDPASFDHPTLDRAVTEMEVVLEAAARELKRQNESARGLLIELREWDHMQTAGDGPYWISRINRVLENRDEY